MTSGDQLHRPEFDAVDLDVDAETAHRYIEDTVAGLRRSEADTRANYRTTRGVLVAVVGHRPTGSGDVNATLAYRTAPPTEDATRKAAKIREALDEHTVDG